MTRTFTFQEKPSLTLVLYTVTHKWFLFFMFFKSILLVAQKWENAETLLLGTLIKPV
jgi:hypothetical protein